MAPGDVCVIRNCIYARRPRPQPRAKTTRVDSLLLRFYGKIENKKKNKKKIEKKKKKNKCYSL